MPQSPVMNVALDAEEEARSALYAAFSSLFYAPPTKEMLAFIARGLGVCNDGAQSDFCREWRALQQAAAQAEPEAVKEEFDEAFIGTGRQPVMLYGSFYGTGFLHEKPLALLRE